MTCQVQGVSYTNQDLKVFFFLEDFSPARDNAFLSEIQIKLQLASSCTGTPNFPTSIINEEEGLGSPEKLAWRTSRKSQVNIRNGKQRMPE